MFLIFDSSYFTRFANALSNWNPRNNQDNIPVWAIKDSAVIINQYLTHIFNEAIKENISPQILKKSTVTPVYKDGSELEPENYRPISITFLFAKILEICIEKQLRIFIPDKNIL